MQIIHDDLEGLQSMLQGLQLGPENGLSQVFASGRPLYGLLASVGTLLVQFSPVPQCIQPEALLASSIAMLKCLSRLIQGASQECTYQTLGEDMYSLIEGMSSVDR